MSTAMNRVKNCINNCKLSKRTVSMYKIILFHKDCLLFISDGAPVLTDAVVHEVRKSWTENTRMDNSLI